MIQVTKEWQKQILSKKYDEDFVQKISKKSKKRKSSFAHNNAKTERCNRKISPDEKVNIKKNKQKTQMTTEQHVQELLFTNYNFNPW